MPRLDDENLERAEKGHDDGHKDGDAEADTSADLGFTLDGHSWDGGPKHIKVVE